MTRLKVAVQILGVCLVLSHPTYRARAQSAEGVVESLNREAMEAYNALDVERAGGMLEEALRIIAEGGHVSAALVARTRVNMGVIYVGALGEHDTGLGFFVAAVCSDPGVEVDLLTRTPDIERLFELARQQARRGSCLQPPAATAQTTDVEKPPRLVLPPIDPPTKPAEPASRRLFFQVGFNTGFALVHHGMRADEPDSGQPLVQLESPGFVPTFALRLAAGYFVADRFALAIPVRIQFEAGAGGPLKHLQLGLRGEWSWLRPKPTGWMLSSFAGFTLGELRAQPPSELDDVDAPFVVSGPAGAHLGLYMLRHRFHPSVGLYSSAQLDFQFPNFMFNVDWTPIGLEVALWRVLRRLRRHSSPKDATGRRMGG